ncbi:unnamed protein product [Moneuplotes crassus]|uniref:Uncharacterized protein n=1 Tax=Euplotes crassus TaxID=5936 RepID=A0AAD1XFY0_EUPCR|nr:unnamed protein product [Moneuplotes crassus]
MGMGGVGEKGCKPNSALTSQVLLIRHAQSLYNEKSLQLKAQDSGSEEYKLNAMDVSMRDCNLSEAGLTQTKNLQEQINLLNIRIVLVSPLKRALSTAYHLFCEHPNFENIQFIVVPEIREIFRSFGSVPGNTKKVLKKFKGKFPCFDTSHLEEECSDTTMDNEKYSCKYLKDKFLPELRAFEDEDLSTMDEDEILNSVKKKILEKYPDAIEAAEEVDNRVHTAKLIVKKYLATLPKSDSDPPKMMIVSHHHFIVEYLGLKKSRQGGTVPNCTIINDPTDYFEIIDDL